MVSSSNTNVSGWFGWVARAIPMLTRYAGLTFFSFLLAFSGFDKWLHFGNFLNTVRQYVLVPPFLAQSLALLIPSFELWLAIAFLIPAWRRHAAISSTVLFSAFAAALSANAAAGVLAPCGCWFSLTLSQSTRPHILFDILLAMLCLTYVLDRSAIPSGGVKGTTA